MLIWVHWPQTQQLWHLHLVEAQQIGLGKSKYHKYHVQQDMRKCLGAQVSKGGISRDEIILEKN